MKFKYTGNNNTFCLELVAYGIMGRGEYLTNGQVIDVPANNTTVINALESSGLFHEVKVTTNKKTTKKETNKKENDE